MELWQMDIVGGVNYSLDGSEAKVVTEVDDHSRFCVSALVVARATAHLRRPGTRQSPTAHRDHRIRHSGILEHRMTRTRTTPEALEAQAVDAAVAALRAADIEVVDGTHTGRLKARVDGRSLSITVVAVSYCTGQRARELVRRPPTRRCRTSRRCRSRDRGGEGRAQRCRMVVARPAGPAASARSWRTRRSAGGGSRSPDDIARRSPDRRTQRHHGRVLAVRAPEDRACPRRAAHHSSASRHRRSRHRYGDSPMPVFSTTTAPACSRSCSGSWPTHGPSTGPGSSPHPTRRTTPTRIPKRRGGDGRARRQPRRTALRWSAPQEARSSST